VKFTPTGGKVQVRLERINSHAEIVVADTGVGIEPAMLPHVFDRFWQAPDTERKERGFGLGLTIAKQLVDLHGGTISADSEGIGRGATFIVRLPLPVSSKSLLDQARRHPTVAPTASSLAAASRLDGLSILVVDDDVETVEALKDLLSKLGATVAVTTSADIALEILDKSSPDVMVSDIGMPARDGFSLARELRRREMDAGHGHRLPLLALTAYGRVDDRVRILEAGFDAHVVKPVELAELSVTIRGLATRVKPLASRSDATSD
jgi:CheY-like chemotaxis protein